MKETIVTGPNFIVIGAPKCGTTSLDLYLKQHPEIYLPEQKELHYFSASDLLMNSNGPGDKAALKDIPQDRKSYARHFASVRSELAVGEISPSYLYYSDSSERIFDELGKIKIVAILRNPIHKAYSQYMHLIKDFRENLPFYEALQIESERRKAGWWDFWRYAESSLYSEGISKYMAVFGRENVKVLIFEHFIENTADALRDLFRFLEVDPSYIPQTSRIYNRSGPSRIKWISRLLSGRSLLRKSLKMALPAAWRYRIRAQIEDFNIMDKPPIPEESHRYLEEYFKQDVAKLNQLLGLDLDWF